MSALLSSLYTSDRGFSRTIAPYRSIRRFVDAVRVLAGRHGLTVPHGIAIAFDAPEVIEARLFALAAVNGGE